MLGFIKKVFITAMTFFNFNLSNINSLECISSKYISSKNNQECKASKKKNNRSQQ